MTQSRLGNLSGGILGNLGGYKTPVLFSLSRKRWHYRILTIPVIKIKKKKISHFSKSSLVKMMVAAGWRRVLIPPHSPFPHLPFPLSYISIFMCRKTGSLRCDLRITALWPIDMPLDSLGLPYSVHICAFFVSSHAGICENASPVLDIKGSIREW